MIRFGIEFEVVLASQFYLCAMSETRMMGASCHMTPPSSTEPISIDLDIIFISSSSGWILSMREASCSGMVTFWLGASAEFMLLNYWLMSAEAWCLAWLI